MLLRHNNAPFVLHPHFHYTTQQQKCDTSSCLLCRICIYFISI